MKEDGYAKAHAEAVGYLVGLCRRRDRRNARREASIGDGRTASLMHLRVYPADTVCADLSFGGSLLMRWAGEPWDSPLAGPSGRLYRWAAWYPRTVDAGAEFSYGWLSPLFSPLAQGCTVC
jgi:hypothetical protein